MARPKKEVKKEQEFQDPYAKEDFYLPVYGDEGSYPKANAIHLKDLKYEFEELIYIVDYDLQRVYVEKVKRIGIDRQGNIYYNDNKETDCYKSAEKAFQQLEDWNDE